MILNNFNIGFFIILYCAAFQSVFGDSFDVITENGNSTRNGTISIPLVRQKTPFEQHLNSPDLRKYGIDFKEIFKPHPGNRTNDTIALRKFMDNEFYAQIVIGHPGQIFNVAFDTAWTESWVLSSKCSSWKSIGCWLHNKYNHLKSSEYRPDNRPFNASDGSDVYRGFYSYDNISIAHTNVTNQSFIEMTSVPSSFIFNKVDGAIGLGLKVGNSYEPVFYKMLAQKKILKPLFSIYMNRDPHSAKGGSISLGFIEHRHIHATMINKTRVEDKILYVDILPGQYWQVAMNKIFLDKDKLGSLSLRVYCETGCRAIMDSSSNTIEGPDDVIADIHDKIGAVEFLLDRYKVDCNKLNTLPFLRFQIAGKNFTLKGTDYTSKLTISSLAVCLSVFVPQHNTKDWVLGGAFLTQYYTIYDLEKKQIGIVKSTA